MEETGTKHFIFRPERIADAVYPRRCALCDAPLLPRERMVCRKCRKNIPFLEQPLCLSCGRPIRDSGEEYCESCRGTRHFYIRGFAPFSYDGAVRDSILRMKYSHRAEYAAFYAQSSAVFGRGYLDEWCPEAIVPIPVHRDRLIRRGYNQAALFARELSKRTGIPCVEALARVHSTKPMKELDPEERHRNLIRAFRADPSIRMPSRILIADDIYTTGATVDAAAAVLQRAGVREVNFVCAAVAPGNRA